ncbi:MAG: efflux RND transporter periplasmic adaptor subunit, partial [Hyphomicrobiales bacterium]|nr:efflux RND transporter periplasmic adaptor subunit [Hyphomicrobiales bacterium]
MSFRTSYLLAAAITIGIAGWMATGTTIIAGTPPEQAPPADMSTGARVVATIRQTLGHTPEPAETEMAAADPGKPAPAVTANATDEEPPFRVRVETLKAAERQAVLTIRGRTEADAKVQVRAETGGILQTRHVRQGDRVKVGDPLCTLDRGAREARLAQARATLAQAEFDLDGAAKHAGRGFTPEARVKALKAAVNAARAAVAEAELDLARTEVKSPLDAIVGEPLAEIGDLVSPGGVCATLIDSDPILFTGQVSERDIGTLSVGMTATARLVTGEELTGRLRYIAAAADPQTRTFRIEIESANPDGTIRDGVTALAAIP